MQNFANCYIFGVVQFTLFKVNGSKPLGVGGGSQIRIPVGAEYSVSNSIFAFPISKTNRKCKNLYVERIK